MHTNKHSSRTRPPTQPFAEVLESTLSSYTAQSWQWDDAPEFGALVQIEQGQMTIFGCTSSITTGSMDPTHYPFPYKKTEQQLQQEHPQIFEFLRTLFTITILGYQIPPNSIYYTIPPQPCKIHTFVRPCSITQTIALYANPNLLHVLFAQSLPNTDELLIAILSQLAKNSALTYQIIDSFSQTFSLLTGNDYRRLKLFLQRIESFIDNSSDY